MSLHSKSLNGSNFKPINNLLAKNTIWQRGGKKLKQKQPSRLSAFPFNLFIDVLNMKKHKSIQTQRKEHVHPLKYSTEDSIVYPNRTKSYCTTSNKYQPYIKVFWQTRLSDTFLCLTINAFSCAAEDILTFVILFVFAFPAAYKPPHILLKGMHFLPTQSSMFANSIEWSSMKMCFLCSTCFTVYVLC